jgi:hypothetical protein
VLLTDCLGELRLARLAAAAAADGGDLHGRLRHRGDQPLVSLQTQSAAVDRIKEHIKSLVGAGISVYTAFFAFGAVRLLPEMALTPALWSVPLITGLTLIIYHQRAVTLRFRARAAPGRVSNAAQSRDRRRCRRPGSAIELAAAGQRVTVLERAAEPGGKMRQLRRRRRGVDAGPTVFTMRWIFDACSPAPTPGWRSG